MWQESVVNTSWWTSTNSLELVHVSHIPRVRTSLIAVRFLPLHMHVRLTLCFASHTDQWWGAGIWPGPLLHTKALRLWPREGLHTTWTHLGQVEMFFPYFLLQFYSHGCVTCPVFALCTESCENAAFCFRPTSLACSLSLHSGFSLQ